MNVKHKTNETCSFGTLGLAVLALGLAACSPNPASVQPGRPAQTASSNPTQTPLPDLATSLAPVASAAPLPQPGPWPTPGKISTPWEQLIDPSAIVDSHWLKYTGQMTGSEEGSFWNYSLEYPSDWYVCSPVTPEYLCIQNIPQQNNPAPNEFIKFELLSQELPPSLDNALPLDAYTTVTLAGERAVLAKNETVPDKQRIFSIAYPRAGRWVILAGYVNLSQEEHGKLEMYSSVLLHMLASFSFNQ